MSGEEEFGYDSPTVPPGAIFLAYDDPARVFPSIAAAERQLEAMDLEEGACPAAYGPKGEVYSVKCGPGRVHIEVTNEPAKPEELKHLLLHYLECCEDPGDATETLECLVDEAWSVERDYWLRMQADRVGGLGTSGWSWVGFAIVAAAIGYLLYRTLR